MTPYYDSEHATIYCGRCEEILPELPPADVVIADPPYGSRRPPQHSKRGALKEVRGNDRIAPEWIFSLRLNDAAAVYSFCTWDTLEEWKRLLAYRLNMRSCIVWDKEIHGLADLKTCWAPRHELILFGSNGRHEFNGRRPIDVIRCTRKQSDLHPYEKPVELMKQLLICTSGALIIDPFMGTGPTLRAAKDMGRKAIGVEIEEEFCEIAAKRLRQNVLEFAN